MARELGLGDRIIQKRIDDDGKTFRKLLEARQELAREYISRGIEVAEVAYLICYEDSNSFYRAFGAWEVTTPSGDRPKGAIMNDATVWIATWGTNFGPVNGNRIARAITNGVHAAHTFQ